MISGLGQKLVKQTQETINQWNLLDKTDKVLIGISGGKDSLALLDCLFRLDFKLTSIHIQIDPSAPLPFAEFCQQRSEFVTVKTDILSQIKAAKRKNYCYMCSRAKRKEISSYALQHGFEKIILAHHNDDVVETMLLNLLLQREISTMLPRQDLFRDKVSIIRPFYEGSEQDIRKYAKALGLPVTDWKCGMETDTNRAWIKNQIRLWQKAHPRQNIRTNIYRAILNFNQDFLPKHPKQKKA